MVGGGVFGLGVKRPPETAKKRMVLTIFCFQ